MAPEIPRAGAVMDCSEIERSLDTYLDGEFDDADRREADLHLQQCDRCRRRVETECLARAAIRMKLRAAMGPATHAGRAPDALRTRVFEALSRERKPLWRRALRPFPLALFCVIAAAAAIFASRSHPDPVIEEAVRKHTRDLPLEITAATQGAEAIPGWLAAKLEFNPRPPRFAAGSVRLIGARLSHLKEWPAAYMRYEAGRGRLGLFIVDDPEGRFVESGRAVRVGPSTVRLVTARGYNVAVWRQREIVYSLVTDLDEGELVPLVADAQAAADR